MQDKKWSGMPYAELLEEKEKLIKSPIDASHSDRVKILNRYLAAAKPPTYYIYVFSLYDEPITIKRTSMINALTYIKNKHLGSYMSGIIKFVCTNDLTVGRREYFLNRDTETE